MSTKTELMHKPQTNGYLPKERPKLPTMDELRAEIDLQLLSKQNDLNVLLNTLPEPHWLKEHPFIKGYQYLPIERIEWLLTRIFVDWHTEVLSYTLIANSVACHVRLHYMNPITGEWKWKDGVGASALQTDKGAKPTDLNALKSSAVEMSLPKAKTEAIKDAAGDLGRLFGRDLNRKDAPDYRGFQGLIDQPLSEKERAHLDDRLALSGMSAIDLCGFLEIGSLEELSKIHYAKALARINDKINYNTKD